MLLNALCEQNGTAFLNSLIFLLIEDEGAAMNFSNQIQRSEA